MPVRPWTPLDSEAIASCRIFEVRRQRSRTAGGVEHDFYSLECGDWVNVVPVTDDGELVLVRQWRHGTQGLTLEIPGGLVDPGETPAAAAARELLEETGYAGAAPEPIGRIHPNPAIQGNVCHTFAIRGARRVAEPSPDGVEQIVEVIALPAAEVAAMVARGEITHALVVVALAHYFGLAAPR